MSLNKPLIRLWKMSPFAKEIGKALEYVVGILAGKSIVANIDYGVILGTGWDDVLHPDEILAEIPLGSIPGFESLGVLAGHSRVLQVCRIGKTIFLVQRGRSHLNEWFPSLEETFLMTRLQVEIMAALGIKKLILTNGAGSLSEDVPIGSLVVIDGFVSLFAGPMPLVGGEFVQADEALDPALGKLFIHVANQQKYGTVVKGGCVVVRGPHFEGPLDKKILMCVCPEALAVGMSTLPEAYIARLYGIWVFAVSFITNSPFETHSHDINQSRAREYADKLGHLMYDFLDCVAIRDRTSAAILSSNS